MRIFFPYNAWRGGFLNSIKNACNRLGHETIMCKKYAPALLNKLMRRSSICQLQNYAINDINLKNNENLIEQINYYNPDIFFNISGCKLFPNTIKQIKEKTNCTTICLVADNPCDPSPKRDKYFAMTLRYYDYLLVPEPSWNKIIRNLAPNANIIKFFGGYDQEKFSPIDRTKITSNEFIRFGCDVSFTGASYRDSAEGSYRAGILGCLEEFNLKIWGDEEWRYRIQFYPSLQSAYYGNRLTLEELRKLYVISKVNLNIPSPQIISSFQPRVFEIAATKGFQIIQYSEELYSIFDSDEVAVFKDINDLKSKIRYYKSNETERNRIINAMYERIVGKFTWDEQLKIVFNNL